MASQNARTVALAAGLGVAVLVATRAAGASAKPAPKPKPTTKREPLPLPPAMTDTQASIPLAELAKQLDANLRAKKKNYDRALCAAFQARSGLDADGAYGAQTAKALAKWVGSAPAPLVATKADADPAKLAVAKLGPISAIKSDGTNTVITKDWTNVPTSELFDWGEDPPSDYSLLSDEQLYAMEDRDIQAARADLPDAGPDQLERAKRAAQRAADLLSPRNVPPITATPRDMDAGMDGGDEDTGESYGGEQAIAAEVAPLAPPTPINLETARKEAAPLAKHIASKKKNYSRQSVKAFQKHAGLVPDGLYGEITRSALEYFGVSNPPAALFKPAPGSATVYVPAI